MKVEYDPLKQVTVITISDSEMSGNLNKLIGEAKDIELSSPLMKELTKLKKESK